VAACRFSRAAEADLVSIGVYTLRAWGPAQTVRDLDEREACCQLLADNPAAGRPCDYVRPGLRRMEHGKHVIFFRHEPGGILVSRILHERMLPERHVINEEGENVNRACVCGKGAGPSRIRGQAAMGGGRPSTDDSDRHDPALCENSADIVESENPSGVALDHSSHTRLHCCRANDGCAGAQESAK